MYYTSIIQSVLFYYIEGSAGVVSAVSCLVSGVCIDRDVIRGSRANESEI